MTLFETLYQSGLEQANMFPTFKINQVINAKNGLELIGGISSDLFKGHKWVDDKWSGALRVNDSIVFGRWQKQNSDWRFFVDSEDTSKVDFSVGQEVELIDGYWGERVELVVDKGIKWKETAYLATDKRDHDHCFSCWATISETENRQYMVTNNREMVCLICFETYVKKRSFDFIDYPKK